MAWFSKKAQPITPTSLPKSDEPFFIPVGFGGLNWDNLKYLEDYQQVPEVNAIINGIARAFSNGKLQIVSKATGKEVSNNESLVKALRNPNPYQGTIEWMMQSRIFAEIYGNEFIYFYTKPGFTNKIAAIYNIPSDIIKVDDESELPFYKHTSKELKYEVTFDGKTEQLPSESMVHISNSSVELSEDGYICGQSNLKALQPAIQNICAAYEARNVIIKNRGALGILSNSNSDATGSTLPMDEKEKAALQNEFRKYGIAKSQHQVIITNLRLQWQQMAIDTDKLKLFEECKADTEKICDAYGYPFELLGNQQGVTFENKKQALKSLYQDTIIPKASEWTSALNSHFETLDKSWEIRLTYDHLPIFQDNLKERGQAMSTTITALSKAFQDGAMTMQQYKNELTKLGI